MNQLCRGGRAGREEGCHHRSSAGDMYGWAKCPERAYRAWQPPPLRRHPLRPASPTPLLSRPRQDIYPPISLTLSIPPPPPVRIQPSPACHSIGEAAPPAPPHLSWARAKRQREDSKSNPPAATIVSRFSDQGGGNQNHGLPVGAPLLVAPARKAVETLNGRHSTWPS